MRKERPALIIAGLFNLGRKKILDRRSKV